MPGPEHNLKASDLVVPPAMARAQLLLRKLEQPGVWAGDVASNNSRISSAPRSPGLLHRLDAPDSTATWSSNLIERFSGKPQIARQSDMLLLAPVRSQPEDGWEAEEQAEGRVPEAGLPRPMLARTTNLKRQAAGERQGAGLPGPMLARTAREVVRQPRMSQGSTTHLQRLARPNAPEPAESRQVALASPGIFSPLPETQSDIGSRGAAALSIGLIQPQRLAIKATGSLLSAPSIALVQRSAATGAAEAASATAALPLLLPQRGGALAAHTQLEPTDGPLSSGAGQSTQTQKLQTAPPVVSLFRPFSQRSVPGTGPQRGSASSKSGAGHPAQPQVSQPLLQPQRIPAASSSEGQRSASSPQRLDLTGIFKAATSSSQSPETATKTPAIGSSDGTLVASLLRTSAPAAAWHPRANVGNRLGAALADPIQRMGLTQVATAQGIGRAATDHTSVAQPLVQPLVQPLRAPAFDDGGEVTGAGGTGREWQASGTINRAIGPVTRRVELPAPGQPQGSVPVARPSTAYSPAAMATTPLPGVTTRQTALFRAPAPGTLSSGSPTLTVATPTVAGQPASSAAAGPASIAPVSVPSLQRMGLVDPQLPHYGNAAPSTATLAATISAPRLQRMGLGTIWSPSSNVEVARSASPSAEVLPLIRPSGASLLPEELAGDAPLAEQANATVIRRAAMTPIQRTGHSTAALEPPDRAAPGSNLPANSQQLPQLQRSLLQQSMAVQSPTTTLARARDSLLDSIQRTWLATAPEEKTVAPLGSRGTLSTTRPLLQPRRAPQPQMPEIGSGGTASQLVGIGQGQSDTASTRPLLQPRRAPQPQLPEIGSGGTASQLVGMGQGQSDAASTAPPLLQPLRAPEAPEHSGAATDVRRMFELPVRAAPARLGSPLASSLQRTPQLPPVAAASAAAIGYLGDAKRLVQRISSLHRVPTLISKSSPIGRGKPPLRRGEGKAERGYDSPYVGSGQTPAPLQWLARFAFQKADLPIGGAAVPNAGASGSMLQRVADATMPAGGRLADTAYRPEATASLAQTMLMRMAAVSGTPGQRMSPGLELPRSGGRSSGGAAERPLGSPPLVQPLRAASADAGHVDDQAGVSGQRSSASGYSVLGMLPKSVSATINRLVNPVELRTKHTAGTGWWLGRSPLGGTLQLSPAGSGEPQSDIARGQEKALHFHSSGPAWRQLPLVSRTPQISAAGIADTADIGSSGPAWQQLPLVSRTPQIGATRIADTADINSSGPAWRQLPAVPDASVATLLQRVLAQRHVIGQPAREPANLRTPTTKLLANNQGRTVQGASLPLVQLQSHVAQRITPSYRVPTLTPTPSLSGSGEPPQRRGEGKAERPYNSSYVAVIDTDASQPSSGAALQRASSTISQPGGGVAVSAALRSAAFQGMLASELSAPPASGATGQSQAPWRSSYSQSQPLVQPRRVDAAWQVDDSPFGHVQAAATSHSGSLLPVPPLQRHLVALHRTPLAGVQMPGAFGQAGPSTRAPMGADGVGLVSLARLSKSQTPAAEGRRGATLLQTARLLPQLGLVSLARLSKSQTPAAGERPGATLLQTARLLPQTPFVPGALGPVEATNARGRAVAAVAATALIQPFAPTAYQASGAAEPNIARHELPLQSTPSQPYNSVAQQSPLAGKRQTAASGLGVFPLLDRAVGPQQSTPSQPYNSVAHQSPLAGKRQTAASGLGVFPLLDRAVGPQLQSFHQRTIARTAGGGRQVTLAAGSATSQPRQSTGEQLANLGLLQMTGLPLVQRAVANAHTNASVADTAPGHGAATATAMGATPLNRSGSHPAGAPELLRPIRPVIQRETEAPTPLTIDRSIDESAEASEDTNQDLENLARQIYARLRRRLLVEAERLGR